MSLEVHLPKVVRPRTFEPLARLRSTRRLFRDPAMSPKDLRDRARRRHVLLGKAPIQEKTSNLSSAPTRMGVANFEHRPLDRRRSSPRRIPRATRTIAQPFQPQLPVPGKPLVTRLAGNPVTHTQLRNVSILSHRQTHKLLPQRHDITCFPRHSSVLPKDQVCQKNNVLPISPNTCYLCPQSIHPRGRGETIFKAKGPTTMKYVIGIDLGTTNSVLAYAPLESESPQIQLLSVPQLTAPGTVESRTALPSFLYLPSPHELGAGTYDLPWAEQMPYAVGEFARKQGAEVPDRTVGAAKSWLCHSRVDRHQSILPWGAADEVPKVSPVTAATRYMEHLIAAWHAAFPDAPIAEQTVVLTVPASFDASARELTREAALAAGLPPSLVLLEEPQAAVYSWLTKMGERWRRLLKVGETLLVCDVGGGTTDLSLVGVAEENGELQLQRIAVGNHLLVGGDNMDLTVAHHVAGLFAEQGVELNPWQSVSLWHSCRERQRSPAGTLERRDAPYLGPRARQQVDRRNGVGRRAAHAGTRTDRRRVLSALRSRRSPVATSGFRFPGDRIAVRVGYGRYPTSGGLFACPWREGDGAAQPRVVQRRRVQAGDASQSGVGRAGLMVRRPRGPGGLAGRARLGPRRCPRRGLLRLGPSRTKACEFVAERPGRTTWALRRPVWLFPVRRVR